MKVILGSASPRRREILSLAGIEYEVVVLHILQHISHCFAVDDLFDVVVITIDSDMHSVGVTKEVVHIAQYLLVCSHEENTDVVMFIGLHRVQGDIICLMSAVWRYGSAVP